MSSSVYETGRLVADAPWLAGHGRRLAYLLGQQGTDGTWGPRGGYALVPTASAVEALLAVLVRADPAGPGVRPGPSWPPPALAGWTRCRDGSVTEGPCRTRRRST
ncbi:hypothetical protein [Micromonospora tarapacensis]|uniref:hypothetical protein n=1 Tax=Micromonospora tarapacensis TaxID=2835305 RepID=UPI001E6063D7|nr:hypothetical protein [Micromonospora tarapacensis]